MKISDGGIVSLRSHIFSEGSFGACHSSAVNTVVAVSKPSIPEYTIIVAWKRIVDEAWTGDAESRCNAQAARIGSVCQSAVDAVEVFDFGYKDEGISMSNDSKMSSINIMKRILTLLRTHTILTFLKAEESPRWDQLSIGSR